MPPDIFQIFNNSVIQSVLSNIWQVFLLTWWIFLPIALALVFWNFWLFYIYVAYIKSQKWLLLEIKIPAGIEKTPKAMEQVFAAFYGIFSFGFRFIQKYWEGHLAEDFLSLEIAGNAGTVRFFIRTPANYRNLIESAIYAQYPTAEINLIPDAEDYQKSFPSVLPNDEFDIWGTDYQLIREGIYPIRTYEYFESPIDERRLDPVAAITEVMSRLKSDEAIWIQMIISPADSSWKKEADAFRDKLLARVKPAPGPGIGADVVKFGKDLLFAPFYPPVVEEKKKETKVPSSLMLLSEGERRALDGIEKKAEKLAFKTVIRFVYIDRKKSFSPLNVSAVMSTFHQFTDLNMNGFRPNTDTLTKARGFFKQQKLFYKKRILFQNILKRKGSSKACLLNTEELATIFHFPSIVVGAPALRRLENKKGSPPGNLPIE